MTTSEILDCYPYLRVQGAEAAIRFYGQAFGAVEEFRLVEPRGRIGHAELRFGGQLVMVSDAYPEYGICGPEKGRPTGSAIHLHVADVDAMTRRASEAGAEVTMEPKDQFYGERVSRLLDPFGHEWLLGSEIEKLSREEMQRRFTEMFEQDS